MTPEIEKLLAVLDMTEEEQVRWFYLNGFEKENLGDCGGKSFTTTTNLAGKIISIKSNDPRGLRFDRPRLADLAFRMRDEVEKDCRPYWFWGSNSMKFVWEKCCDGELPPAHEGYCIAYRWFFHSAQPIHWIIAAEIAKAGSK